MACPMMQAPIRKRFTQWAQKPKALSRGNTPQRTSSPSARKAVVARGTGSAIHQAMTPKEDGQRAHANFRDAFRRGNQQRQGKQRRAGQEMEESFFSFQALGGGGRH